MEAKRRKIEVHSGESVTEQAVGITEFVSDLPGYSGLIKQRYSDFQVNEISLDGTVVVLKSAGEGEKELLKEDTEEAKEPISSTIEPNENTSKLAEIVGDELVENLFKLISGEIDAKSLKTTSPIDNKDQRTLIHTYIREGFQGRLDSKTEDGFVVVHKVNGNKRKRQPRGPQAPKGHEYLQFTLYKENKDTMEAVSLITRLLHIPTKAITFAGTKDRRAVTTQRLSWRRGNIARLQGLTLYGNLVVSDFQFCKNTLKLGDLQGNQFGIVIRDLQAGDLSAVNSSLESLRDFGFINYYGLQRFGTFSVPSHMIGKFILCEDYDKAVEGLLNPQDYTVKESEEARKVWAEERDASRALELMPKRCLAEYSLLTALVDSENSLNAILRVPHSLKTMYVHAYQSYVWNSMASKRVQLSSTKPLLGDLVYGEVEDGVKRARPIMQEEIDSGSKTIFDVVLPTPGFDIVYPENMVKHYEELMSADNIDCHNMKHKIKEFSLFGSYRSLLAKPLFLTWDFRRYLNEDDTILLTDKEAIEKDEKLAPEPEEGALNVKNSVVLKLGLSASQYATMALREAMKQETSRHGRIYFA